MSVCVFTKIERTNLSKLFKTKDGSRKVRIPKMNEGSLTVQELVDILEQIGEVQICNGA